MKIEIPEIKPMQMADITLPEKLILPNNIPLYQIEGGVQEIIRFDILFPGGYATQEQPLQALFTNRMLREGSTHSKASKISRTLDSCGAWIETYCSQRCSHITLYTLKRHFAKLAHTLREIITEPDFPEKNLEIIRTANKTHFLVNSQKVGSMAQRHFEKAIWGENHRFGRIVTLEDYDGVTADTLRNYHRKIYGSGNCTIFVSGKIDDTITETIATIFGNEEWGTATPIIPTISPLEGGKKERIDIKIEGAMQSAIKIGAPILPTGHTDYYALKYLTVLLGGFFGSRLMTNIREKNGYTYHIESEVSTFGDKHVLSITTEAANEYVEPLIKEVYNELHRLQDEPVSAEEMQKLRNCTLGELCREYEGPSAKADVFISTWLSGEQFDSVNRYLDTIRTTTAEEFMRIARQHLNTENMTEIIAGA